MPRIPSVPNNLRFVEVFIFSLSLGLIRDLMFHDAAQEGSVAETCTHKVAIGNLRCGADQNTVRVLHQRITTLENL